MRPLALAAPAAALVATLAVAGTARAGGFYISDVGTRGLARAGAFVAAPDSLLAVHYNPAALSLLSGVHVEIDLTAVALDFTFERHCPCVDPTRADAAMLDAALEASFTNHPAHTNTPLGIPYIAVGYGFPFYDFTVAFAVWGPNSGNYEFGHLPDPSSRAFNDAAKNAPQRYTALSVDTLEANWALGFGLQPIEGLRIGGAVMIYSNGNDQELHLWLNSATFATTPEDPNFDVPITLRFSRDIAINWELGASYSPISGLTVGGSFRGKRSIRADGTLDINLPMFLQSLGMVTGNQIEIELNTPPLTRLGVQYELEHVFKAELAFVYEYWKVYDRIVVRPKDIVVTIQSQEQKLGTILQPRGWENTFSLRAGGEVNVFQPWLGLRAGVFFEPAAIPADRLDPSRLDLDKTGFALGASTTFYGFTLEIAGMYVLMNGVDVKDSKVKLTGPLEPDFGSHALDTTIGNGKYSASYLIGSASLSFALDNLFGI